MTRKIRRNMAKREAALRWCRLREVWPEFRLGPEQIPQRKRHRRQGRSGRVLERANFGYNHSWPELLRRLWM